MVLLSEKGAHGVSVRCDKVCMLFALKHACYVTPTLTSCSMTKPHFVKLPTVKQGQRMSVR